jgi:hypothetical protein
VRAPVSALSLVYCQTLFYGPMVNRTLGPRVRPESGLLPNPFLWADGQSNPGRAWEPAATPPRRPYEYLPVAHIKRTYKPNSPKNRNQLQILHK